MSRGPGRLQRRILDHVKAASGYRASRKALEVAFVDHGQATSSNLLRAIKSLDRMDHVSFVEGSDPDRSWVSIPRPVRETFSDEFVLGLLAESRYGSRDEEEQP